MSKSLTIAQFGDRVLQRPARSLAVTEIESEATRELVVGMDDLLSEQKLGIGLAAPQVGESVALSIIRIQKTQARPDVEEFHRVIINPKITKIFGRKTPMWEGCISSGLNEDGKFAEVPRYEKIELTYYDLKAKKHVEILESLPAHVAQHEVDHLNGVLFTDHIDADALVSYDEYVKIRGYLSDEQ